MPFAQRLAKLRETFGFDGTPIRLVFRDRTAVKLPRHKRNPGRAGGPKASMSKGSQPKASGAKAGGSGGTGGAKSGGTGARAHTPERPGSGG